MRLVVDRDGHLEATDLFEPLVIVAPDGKYGICLRDETIEVVKDGKIVFRGSDKPTKAPVCSTCKDTHTMPATGFPCNHCPIPCQGCRAGGTGAFCERTPCSCACHRRRKR